MTIILQIATAGLILAAVAFWWGWVHESNRSIVRPEHLSTIQVHGLPAGEAEALSRALLVGVVAEIAEHRRVVDFINRAASLEDRDSAFGLTPSLMRVSAPTPPTLISRVEAPKGLDLTLEFAGSKVETRGLQSFFTPSERRGGLLLSLLLRPSEGDKLVGRVSASFRENAAYGFVLDVDGTSAEIAEQIAKRFLQASYAEQDAFLNALPPEDFRALWDARLQAAEIAHRSLGAGGAGPSPATASELRPDVAEARAVYDGKSAIFLRYRGRPEIQRLAAYMASAAEYFDVAISHLGAVADGLVPGSADHGEVMAMMAAFEADRDTQAAVLTRAAQTTGAAAAPRADVDALEQQILTQPAFEVAGLPDLAERARGHATPRRTTIALVLGGLGDVGRFGDRIRPATPADRSATPTPMSEHTFAVAGVVATLAPRAEIVTYNALQGSGGGASQAQVVTALERAIRGAPDIVLLTLDAGASDGTAMTRAFRAASDAGILLVASAGNGGERVVRVGSDLPGIVYVGAWGEDDARARYSNFGPGVALYAPGGTLVIQEDALSEMRGTTVSAAVAAAVAANLAHLSMDPVSGAALARLLIDEATREVPSEAAEEPALRILHVDGTG